jgi:hypothetical protein
MQPARRCTRGRDGEAADRAPPWTRNRWIGGLSRIHPAALLAPACRIVRMRLRWLQTRPTFTFDPVSERDIEALAALYTRASPRSRYLRFFTPGISIDREAQRLLTPSDNHVALLAEHDGLAVGIASYES